MALTLDASGQRLDSWTVGHANESTASQDASLQRAPNAVVQASRQMVRGVSVGKHGLMRKVGTGLGESFDAHDAHAVPT